MVPSFAHNTTMARKKPTTGGGKDRHKPSRMTRVRESLAAQLDLLAERKASDFTEQVNIAVRLLLEHEGLWPPKPKDE